MRIGLIRHGETDWNVRGVYQGASDVPLNRRGEGQARDAGRLLRGRGWQGVCCSPLRRARQTAEIIAAKARLACPEVLPRLTERGFGELEGRRVRNRDGSRAELDGARGVEPAETVVARARAQLVELARRPRSGHLLVVTHGALIRLVLDSLLDFPAPRIANLSLSVLESAPDGSLRVLTANGYPLDPAGAGPG